MEYKRILATDHQVPVAWGRLINSDVEALIQTYFSISNSLYDTFLV
jgi:hypothetical protein